MESYDGHPNAIYERLWWFLLSCVALKFGVATWRTLIGRFSRRAWRCIWCRTSKCIHWLLPHFIGGIRRSSHIIIRSQTYYELSTTTCPHVIVCAPNHGMPNLVQGNLNQVWSCTRLGRRMVIFSRSTWMLGGFTGKFFRTTCDKI